jgi:hypothetical protein
MGKYLAFAEIQSTSSCTCNNSNSLEKCSTATAEDDSPPHLLQQVTASDSIHVVAAFRRKFHRGTWQKTIPSHQTLVAVRRQWKCTLLTSISMEAEKMRMYRPAHQ